jgi:hypothetical protein
VALLVVQARVEAPPAPTAEGVAVKEAIAAARKGKTSQAEELQKSIGDPVARKLIEWAILRSDETASVSFNRYMSFVAENPSWPAVAMLRRRAEATLWSDRRDPAFVRAYFGKERPLTTKGKFALARAIKITDINARDHDLFVTRLHQPLHLFYHLANGFGARSSADIGNDAIGAKGVAPILHFHKGARVIVKGLDGKFGNFGPGAMSMLTSPRSRWPPTRTARI